MSKQSTSIVPNAPQASRRALLMGFAAAATPMAPALANALSEPAPAAADPIFAAIDRHRAELELYDTAHAHFRAMRALYPHPAEEEPDPDDFLDWPIEQRFAFRKAQAARYKGTPGNIAFDRWNNQCGEVDEATEALVETCPTTIIGAAAALEYWAEFSARLDECSEFDFLATDCGARLMTGVTAALRNIVARGQA
jgi:hypothetical protein